MTDMPQMLAAIREISEYRRQNYTQPDEIAMCQTTRDKIVHEVFPDAADTIAPQTDGTIMGIPIFIDDTLPPGQIEVRMRLRPGMTPDDFRRLYEAGYRLPPPVFDSTKFDWLEVTGQEHRSKFGADVIPIRHSPERYFQ